MLARLASTLGAQRLFLCSVTVVLILTAPLAFGESHFHDWRILPTVIAPAMMVIMVFVLALDMLMTTVFLRGDDHHPAERQRLRRVLRIETGLWLLLLLAWIPYMRSLLPA